MAYEKKYMEYALSLAHLSELEGEVPVGAVVVKKGRVIGAGRNRREREKNPLWHAEIEAVHTACRALGGWRLAGCDLYVTLEPCLMCAGAVVNSRIGQVYFGAYDPKEGACGSAVSALTRGGTFQPSFEGGHEEERCESQLSDFFERLRKRKEDGVTLRRLSNIDYPDVAPLFCALSRETGEYGELAAGGAEALARFFSKGYPMVGVQKGRVVAMGAVDIGGEIRVLGVSPGLRGRKLGQGLLYSLEKKAKGAGRPFVWAKKRPASAGFFDRCGYTQEEDRLIRSFYAQSDTGRL